MICTECQKELTESNTYRCRICDDRFCESCSLKHFGLYVNKNGDVRYRNPLKSALWILFKKTFLNFSKKDK